MLLPLLACLPAVALLVWFIVWTVRALGRDGVIFVTSFTLVVGGSIALLLWGIGRLLR